MLKKPKVFYKGSSGIGGSSSSHTSVADTDGSRIDLSESPLIYGRDDSSLSDDDRRTIEEFEDKRRNAKIEFNRLLDDNGNIVTENRGGRGSVKTKFSDMEKAKTFTHNHPPRAGRIRRNVFRG